MPLVPQLPADGFMRRIPTATHQPMVAKPVDVKPAAPKTVILPKNNKRPVAPKPPKPKAEPKQIVRPKPTVKRTAKTKCSWCGRGLGGHPAHSECEAARERVARSKQTV